MKKSIKNIVALISSIFFITGCSLEELNYSSVTSNTYFEGEEQFEELVAEVYNTMRPLLRNTGFMWHGTDIIERYGALDDSKYAVNDYTPMTGYEGDQWWADNYNVITKVNVAFDRGAEIDNVSESIRRTREAELHTLRAYAYFNLVEVFGGVPLLLHEIKTPTFNFVRASEEEIYSQIVDDLETALEAGRLPDKPSAYGRVAQGMANHLLGKVLLTRSYKSYGQSTDLTKAISCFEKVIQLHPFAGSWSELFGPGSYANSVPGNNTEIIFAIRYSTDQSLNSGWGNNLYMHFKFNISKFPGGDENDSPYRAENQDYQPTKYFLGLYEENDIRASEDYILRTIYAGKDENDIQAGDPVMYMPRVAMTDAEKAAYKALHPTVKYIINPDEYHTYQFQQYCAYPVIYKFEDPGVTTKVWADTDPKGTSDTYVFRVAETMMLLAEAFIKQGNADKATDLINELRTRAGSTLLSGTATIEDVLEESARELFGESNRWMDLKRTGTLLDRAYRYNAFVNKHHTSAPSGHFLLRPIPITQIDLSGGSITQNPGYSGS